MTGATSLYRGKRYVGPYTGQCTECGKALYNFACMAGCEQHPTEVVSPPETTPRP